MERGLMVDRMTGHLGQAALYLQAGIQGGDFEACLQNCDTPLETILLEVQSAACAGAFLTYSGGLHLAMPTSGP